jgi:hypothetical protein
MINYLLSTGRSTTKVERYILDLFRLNIQIFPGDIPGSNVGFDFVITDTKKDEILSTIRSRVSSLVKKIQSKFNGININVNSIEFLDEERVLINIEVNDYTDTISINVYEN